MHASPKIAALTPPGTGTFFAEPSATASQMSSADMQGSWRHAFLGANTTFFKNCKQLSVAVSPVEIEPPHDEQPRKNADAHAPVVSRVFSSDQDAPTADAQLKPAQKNLAQKKAAELATTNGSNNLGPVNTRPVHEKPLSFFCKTVPGSLGCNQPRTESRNSPKSTEQQQNQHHLDTSRSSPSSAFVSDASQTSCSGPVIASPQSSASPEENSSPTVNLRSTSSCVFVPTAVHILPKPQTKPDGTPALENSPATVRWSFSEHAQQATSSLVSTGSLPVTGHAGFTSVVHLRQESIVPGIAFSQEQEITPAPHSSVTAQSSALMQGGERQHTASVTSLATPAMETNFAAPSGPARLEIGVLDSTHGWVKVRAEMTCTGNINASLTVSAPSHETMHAALPEIAGYVQSEGIRLARLDIHAPSNVSSSAIEAQANRNSGSGRQREESAQQAPVSSSSNSAPDQHAGDEGSAEVASATQSIPLPAPMWAQPTYATGGWLSICA